MLFTPQSALATAALCLLVLLLACIGSFLFGTRVGRLVAEQRLQRLREELGELQCILGDDQAPVAGGAIPAPVPLPDDGRMWPVWGAPSKGCRARRTQQTQPAPTRQQPAAAQEQTQ
jgi:hypothetical protein